MNFDKLDTPGGIGKFNGHLANRSYIVGYVPSKSDADLFTDVSKVYPNGPDAKFVHARRWWNHINSYNADERNTSTVATEQSAAKKAQPKEEEKKEAAPQASSTTTTTTEEEGIDQSVMDEVDDLFGDVDENAAQKLKQQVAAGATKKPVPVQKSNVVLDVKPIERETDMALLEQKVRAIELNGLNWGPSKLVEVAYGVKKLQITCVVVDDLVYMEDLEEKIMAFEDLVQSVDVAAMVRAG